MFWKFKKTKPNSLFISIGGGINQIPLIEEAKELGLHTIGVDTNICAAGMHKCDIRIQESIVNYNEIYDKLEELLVEGEITGVLTKSFGPAIKTAAFIAEKLNIPLLPFNKADDLINKEKMKKIFKNNNIKSPDFIIYNKERKNDKIKYPFVIKPVIGHAKTKVELIYNLKDFNNYTKNISLKDCNYLIEKYIEGNEIIAIGIVYKSKFYLVEITDKTKSAPPYFVDVMHISPSKYIHLWEQIQETGQKVVESFEIYTSPLLMELIVTENEEIYLIETAPEFGGEFISDILIPERTGYNIIKESIKAVINNNFSPPPLKRKFRNAVVIKYITGTKGILSSFNPIKIKCRGLIFSRIFKDIGSNIRRPQSNHDRIGIIAAKGRTIEEAVGRADEAEKLLNIRITDNDLVTSDKRPT
ncbi:MAG: ATP-grasp domain-containing protein [Spirochaetota bacterium]